MREISRFSVRSVPEESPYSLHAVELIDNGVATKATVLGYFLACQYAVGDCFLLLTTADSWEDNLTLSLLDAKLNILDQRHLGIPYASAELSDCRIEGERSLSFTFFGEERWLLNVLEQPRLMLGDIVKSQPWIQPRRLLRRRYLALSMTDP